VIDLARGVETKHLLAGRGAAYLALSSDGRRMYCTHIYPRLGAFRTPPESEVTVIDTRRHGNGGARKSCTDAAGVSHVVSADGGRVAIAAEMRPKNLNPAGARGTRVGDWQRALGVWRGYRRGSAGPHRRVGPILYASFRRSGDPGNRQLFVSTTGSDSVTAIDLPKLLAYIRAATSEQRRLMANDLSASANYVSARIPVGRAPKGLALSPDGKRLYVANRMDDTITVVDTAAHRAISTIALGRPIQLTPARRGERLFYSARFAFQGHFGCANCHIEATLDELSWDLEPDGFGVDIVENRLLEDIADTAPFKWKRQQSGHGHRVRAAHGEVLLPRPELFAGGAGRRGGLHQVDSAAPQPVSPPGWRADGPAGTRQGHFRSHPRERRLAHRRCQSMLCVPLGSALH